MLLLPVACLVDNSLTGKACRPATGGPALLFVAGALQVFEALSGNAFHFVVALWRRIPYVKRTTKAAVVAAGTPACGLVLCCVGMSRHTEREREKQQKGKNGHEGQPKKTPRNAKQKTCFEDRADKGYEQGFFNVLGGLFCGLGLSSHSRGACNAGSC